MRLGTRLASRLERAAKRYGDDPFFAIRQEGGLFVSNWNLGVVFPEKELINSPILRQLEERAEQLAIENDDYRDVLYHIKKRGWRDILVGNGICRDLELVRNKEREAEVFAEQGWRVLTFSTKSKRYFIKRGYFEIIEDVLEDVRPVIFRSTHKRDGYRVMLLMDKMSEVRGFISAVTEWGLRNPIDRQKEYEEYIRNHMELC